MKGPPGKLKPDEVREIRATAAKAAGRPWRKQAARRYGVSPGYMGDVASRRRYAWVQP